MTKAIVFVRACYKHVRLQNTGIETCIPKKRPCDTREVTIVIPDARMLHPKFRQMEVEAPRRQKARLNGWGHVGRDSLHIL
jgi:hypothetical protein